MGASVLAGQYPTVSGFTPDRRSSQILLGHRDGVQRALLSGVLIHDGYQVLSADNGLQLLEWMADGHPIDIVPQCPDLVLIELNLPKRRGIDLLADLRTVGWKTPFVMIANEQDRPLFSAVRKLRGAVIFVTPYDMDDLRTAVSVLLSSHRPQQQVPRAPGRERRASARVQVHLWAEERTGHELYLQRMEELGAGGIRLRHCVPRRQGEKIQLRFNLPASREIDVLGQVVSVQPQQQEFSLGIKFLDLQATDRARINRFIDQRLNPAEQVPYLHV